ncbi:hypothetical protein [Achromobacter aloeverae]|uniref:DUF4123 domain-containing protein n=1 Tax=Achromobacter aloeverae TaxID=1750518 RepID=A0A4Q1HGC5_9BURK|nr:hypothetical protein [Achromobacter aloeverae]RXN86235.1 hypothetical protein C7R54_21160 [Achromobacter aloeverae]
MSLVYADLREYAYAIADGALAHAGPARMASQALVPAQLARSAGVMPRLYDIASATPLTREAALAMALAQEADGEALWLCGLLDVDEGVDQATLARALTTRLVLPLPAVGPCFFRYFDPRVLIQLQWLFTPAQMAWLMGPVRCWKYSIGGAWEDMRRPEVFAAESPGITRRQAFALQRMNVINTLLERLRPASVAALRGAGQDILRQLEKARDHGLARLQDQEEYAWHGVTVHPEFDRHPRMQALLANLPADADYPYRVATADLRPEDFDRMREDLNDPAGHTHERSFS